MRFDNALTRAHMRLDNALTIDLEDWFQVSNLEQSLSRSEWENCEFRLHHNAERMLDALDRADKKATFFVLGWNAERFPSLIKEIARRGHDIASHGYFHKLIYLMSPREFRDDLRRSIDVIGAATGTAPQGHRAASFSLTEKCLWALEILADEGITYDSSMFPIRHDRYGVSRQWEKTKSIVTNAGSIVEVPITPWCVGGTNLPFSGGGYFRLLPYSIVKRITRAMNAAGRSVVFYFHPWEIDAGIPRFNLGMIKSFRSYHNIECNWDKFEALLRDFDLAPISEVLKWENVSVRTLRRFSTERWVLL